MKCLDEFSVGLIFAITVKLSYPSSKNGKNKEEKSVRKKVLRYIREFVIAVFVIIVFSCIYIVYINRSKKSRCITK